MSYSVGIDLGGTNIAVGVAEDNRRLAAKISVPTGVGRPWRVIAQDMVAATREALDAAGLSPADCLRVGVGIPGVCGDGGTVVYANNLEWGEIPLGDFLSRELGLPVLLDNDANCAALGEVLAGAASGFDNAIMVTLGTGVGGGIILNRHIYQGGWHAGGEIGHTVLSVGGESCKCGRQGCFEAYASATALIRQTRRAAGEDPASSIHTLCGGDLSRVNGRTAFDAAAQGDETARWVVSRYIEYLAEGLANLVNIFRPQCLILGGGISNQGETLLGPVRELVARYSYGGSLLPVPSLVAAALGNDAGILGAAALD